MSTNKKRCGQNQPRKVGAMTEDACKMNEDKDRRFHRNLITYIVQQFERMARSEVSSDDKI